MQSIMRDLVVARAEVNSLKDDLSLADRLLGERDRRIATLEQLVTETSDEVDKLELSVEHEHDVMLDEFKRAEEAEAALKLAEAELNAGADALESATKELVEVHATVRQARGLACDLRDEYAPSQVMPWEDPERMRSRQAVSGRWSNPPQEFTRPPDLYNFRCGDLKEAAAASGVRTWARSPILGMEGWVSGDDFVCFPSGMTEAQQLAALADIDRQQFGANLGDGGELVSMRAEVASLRAEFADLRAHSIERVRELWGDHEAYVYATYGSGWVALVMPPGGHRFEFQADTEREAIDAAIAEGERRQAERDAAPATGAIVDATFDDINAPQTAEEMQAILEAAEQAGSAVRITWHPQAREQSRLSLGSPKWVTEGEPVQRGCGWEVEGSWLFSFGDPSPMNPTVVAVEVQS